jgi:hypothetical protein
MIADTPTGNELKVIKSHSYPTRFDRLIPSKNRFIECQLRCYFYDTGALTIQETGRGVSTIGHPFCRLWDFAKRYLFLRRYNVRAVAVFICLSFVVCGFSQPRAQDLSAVDTVRYLQDAYSKWAIRPIRRFEMEYSPPYLDITWDWGDYPCAGCDLHIRSESIRIDLRYVASVYGPPNAGYGVVLDCVRGSGCGTSFGYTSLRGEEDIWINYKVRFINRIVNALNHLASIHASERPKGVVDPFAYCDPKTSNCR